MWSNALWQEYISWGALVRCHDNLAALFPCGGVSGPLEPPTWTSWSLSLWTLLTPVYLLHLYTNVEVWLQQNWSCCKKHQSWCAENAVNRRRDYTKSQSNISELIFAMECLLSSSHFLFPFVMLPTNFYNSFFISLSCGSTWEHLVSVSLLCLWDGLCYFCYLSLSWGLAPGNPFRCWLLHE